MITVFAGPKDYTPAFNSMYFQFRSDQVAQADFTYVIKCTDVLSGFIQYFNIPLPVTPSDKVWWDASAFAANFSESYLTPSTGNPLTLGWRSYPFLRPIIVNIGESYGDSPEPVYYPGDDLTFKTWNACYKKTDFFTYQTSDAVFEDSTGEVLSNTETENVYSNHSTFIYAINRDSAYLMGVRIESLDSQGNVIQTSDIDNPYFGESPIENEYLGIDVGLRSLNLISASLVSGTYPPVNADATSYRVYTVGFLESGSPPVLTPVYTLQKTFNIKTCTPFTAYAVHYLARSGAFDTCLFDKNSFTTSDIQKDEYDSYYFQEANPSSNENPQAFGLTKIANLEEQETITLNTGFISAGERLKYTELITSTLIYLDLGASGLMEIIPLKRTWDSTPRVRGKKENLSAEFRFASKESRQNQ